MRRPSPIAGMHHVLFRWCKSRQNPSTHCRANFECVGEIDGFWWIVDLLMYISHKDKFNNFETQLGLFQGWCLDEADSSPLWPLHRGARPQDLGKMSKTVSLKMIDFEIMVRIFRICHPRSVGFKPAGHCAPWHLSSGAGFQPAPVWKSTMIPWDGCQRLWREMRSGFECLWDSVFVIKCVKIKALPANPIQ